MATRKADPALTRAALAEILEWAQDEDPQEAPPRAVVANAVRLSLRTLENIAPGNSVEVRVPPFAAVQCIEGPKHTRGTPPNVVEMAPRTWLRVALGLEPFQNNPAIESSGTRADEVAGWLPIIAAHRLS